MSPLPVEWVDEGESMRIRWPLPAAANEPHQFRRRWFRSTCRVCDAPEGVAPVSLDAVDDLHAAEDFAESLRVLARQVVTAFDAFESNSDMTATEYEAFQQKINALDQATKVPFTRPGCYDEGEDQPRTCDEDCGGHHPWEDDERVGPAEGSEPEGSGFGKPWAPQVGVTFLAASAFVRSIVEIEPGPPAGAVAIDIEGKWNHGAKDTLSIIAHPQVAIEWAAFMMRAASAAPRDADLYRREHP